MGGLFLFTRGWSDGDIIGSEELAGIGDNAVAEPLGLQDLKVGTLGAELLDKIESGSDKEREKRIVGTAFRLLLRMVQGQGTQIVSQHRRGANEDGLGFGVAEDAIVVTKIAFGTERTRDGVAVGRGREGDNTVEGIVAQFGVDIALSRDVPALTKDTHTIRCKAECVRFGTVVALIGDFKDGTGSDGVDDGHKEPLPRRDVLEDDMRADALLLRDDLLHGKRVENPMSQVVAVEFVGVSDIVVGLPATLSATDVDVVEFLYLRAVALECAARVLALARVVEGCIRPTRRDVAQSDMSRGIDGVDEPDVTAKRVSNHGCQCWLMLQR